ncbi:EAL domain-containing response regulator [Enterovibrio sp. ZSDZ42]|uniref:EAL domain-containing response regulator n=1 Tax=Enterovibrio gelatinilyticus TaxID=2899819 RepID=A0ABT5R589_9GAMM|nr:EAL domain-containing response regulator [Enterovibrio sp. ZSDZ42]MDD1795444.1 EAL domain-containing response regulator [Enterovibrio sp. ZSDZ42]
MIDDSESVLMLIRSMLNRLGYEKVSCFSSPQLALKEINYEIARYDVVFTNLGMVDIDGMCVIRELGKMKYRGAVCIISDLENRVTELAAEIAKLQWINLLGSIPKPITLYALERVLKKADTKSDVKLNQIELMPKDELIEHIICGHVVPYYQPKVNFLTKKVESLEVLARIVFPESPYCINPCCFISTAVQYGLIDLLTASIAERTALEIDELSSIFGGEVSVGINLSATQLDDLSIPNRLGALFKAKSVSNSRVTLEITEESSLQSPEQLESLNRLRMQGYGVSLDDFGTGYANFLHLRNLPFTEVKIDRSLITNIHLDHFGQTIVRSLVDFTVQSDCVIVAEGVEKEEELKYLIENYPSMLIQGFLICRPKTLNELAEWYGDWRCDNVLGGYAQSK